MASFSGPTPPNTMTESEKGYGYAECSRCGFRTMISDKMSPENDSDLYSYSKDRTLLHNCDQEPYAWPKSARERSKLKMSLLTAFAELDRWQGVIERCLDYFSPETSDEAREQSAGLRTYIDYHRTALHDLMEKQPESFP